MNQTIFEENIERESKIVYANRDEKTLQEVHDEMILRCLTALGESIPLEIKGKKDYNEWGIDMMRLLNLRNSGKITIERHTQYRLTIRKAEN